ncbi:MAG: DUF1553 domain-containing protein [Planctomycetota bacterium]|nr:DUF1553 domain-containing protein [Planctomycetota bacterium]
MSIRRFHAAIALLAAAAAAQDPTSDAVRAEHFEARIRPVLVEHCYACHSSAGKTRGGLALDDRTGTRAESDSGFAVIPGAPEQSLILKVLRHEIPGQEMPKDGARLDDAVVADFEKWIREGAFDPRDAAPSAEELSELTSWEARLARRKAWWSWQPIRAPSPPPSNEWSDHPVDRFTWAKMDEHGLAPAPRANRRTLIRRLHYAVTGLPPTVADIDAFLADSSADATERLIDRLLDSPRFGERWARHWMDLMRYADSHGSEGDPRIPRAFEYRDYLIRAFNADVPYDQLVREHIAGDLLAEPRINDELDINESAIGTAHWRMVFHGFAPTDAYEEKVRFIDDEINVLGKAFLAQTISCARCHDHKFDAISQADYYALFGILASCRPTMQDVNRTELQDHNKAELRNVKNELRQALARVWQESAPELTAQLFALEGSLKEQAERRGSAFGILDAVDRKLAEDASFDEAWQRLRRDRPDTSEPVRRWHVTTAAGMREWFPSGNGLEATPADAGEFAVAAEGNEVLEGIYPSGVYTHLLSSRHRGVLQSARFDLDGEYEVWFRVSGGGGARLRYAIQDYPRSGTVYPIPEIKSDDWTWQRLDFSYWRGDSAHLELYTGQDAPVQTGGSERSWFGLREVVLREKGSGRPAEPVGALHAALLESDSQPASRAALAERAARLIEESVGAWARAEASDTQALMLDACLRSGLLTNAIDCSPRVAELVERYRHLERDVPLPRRVPGLVEADAADHPLLERGNHKTPGQLVPRRFLGAIDPTPYDSPNSGRLQLAEDLVRTDNPLTARVIANRIWHHLFGRGLVSTPDNFGQLGAQPSHPEMLDYLATRIRQRGWSIKDSIRFLLTSATWQQAATASAEAHATDPDNVWLSHANIRRLDAEAIRDSMFAVTDRLDDRMYGPGFGANSRTPRRSIYMAMRRNSLDAFLEAFDAPAPFAPVGARHTTNVPAQSLTLLNDPMVRDLAAQWGDSMRTNRDRGDERARYAHMFEALTGREPQAEELAALSDYAAACRATMGEDAQRRAVLEQQITADVGALEAVLAPVRERLLAAVEASDTPEGPAPFARWDFREGLEDTVGSLGGELHGTARLEDGGLVLDGNGHLSTPAIDEPVGAKTLEAWVQLTDASQSGGGVITLQDLRGDAFDSIVYAERKPRRWLAGSDNFRRTEDFQGTDESSALAEPIHLAIAYDGDGLIRGYRNGQPYGRAYKKAELARFQAGDCQVLVGLRHGSPSGGRLLRGVVYEARLHLRALSSDEVAASAAGGAFVAHRDVIAALDNQAKQRVSALEDAIADGRAELEQMGEAAHPDESWARVAHALFNLKEFLYIQ